MAPTAPASSAADRARALFHTYTRDLSREDLERLFTHDTPDAYDFFARGLHKDELAGLPWWKRAPLRFRQVFVAFTLRLTPARRALYFGALAIAVLGLLRLFRGFAAVPVPFGTPFFQVALPLPVWADGTVALVISLVLVNLLVLLEVAERLSLKGELEVAREIQLALLPRGTYSAADIEISGVTKPANTVGRLLRRAPAGGRPRRAHTWRCRWKGSPAALLMALLLAALRTLVEERLEAAALVARLNIQIRCHSPASRFITLVYSTYEPSTGRLDM